MSDLIRRQDAIKAIRSTAAQYVPFLNGVNETLPMECEIALRSVPSAEPKTGWIPVSERLPKARESVILSTKEWTGEGCYWETTKHHVIWKGYRWNTTYWDDEVIAWMPLPEPYKEDKGE